MEDTQDGTLPAKSDAREVKVEDTFDADLLGNPGRSLSKAEDVAATDPVPEVVCCCTRHPRSNVARRRRRWTGDRRKGGRRQPFESTCMYSVHPGRGLGHVELTSATGTVYQQDSLTYNRYTAERMGAHVERVGKEVVSGRRAPCQVRTRRT